VPVVVVGPATVVVVVGAATVVVVVVGGHSDAIIEPQVPVVVTVPQVHVPALHALTTSFVQRLNTPPLNPDSPASSAQALRLHGDEGGRRLSERGCNAQPEKGGHNGGRPNHSTHDFLRLAAGTGSARVLFECESTIPRGCRLNEDRNTDDRGGAGELVCETRAGAEQHPSLCDRTARE